MKLDAHMPLFGNDFFQAIEGRTDAVGLGYLRALWYYWSHTHCEGLPDEDDFLRRLCRVDITEWCRTKPVIFGEFFTKDETGKWQQLRAQKSYRICMKAYARKVDAIEKARKFNPLVPVNSPVNRPDNKDVNCVQTHVIVPISSIPSGSERPTLAEVRTFAESPHCGFPPKRIEEWFHDQVAQEWKYATNWKARLLADRNKDYWRGKPKPQKPTLNYCP